MTVQADKWGDEARDKWADEDTWEEWKMTNFPAKCAAKGLSAFFVRASHMLLNGPKMHPLYSCFYSWLPSIPYQGWTPIGWLENAVMKREKSPSPTLNCWANGPNNRTHPYTHTHARNALLQKPPHRVCFNLWLSLTLMQTCLRSFYKYA